MKKQSLMSYVTAKCFSTAHSYVINTVWITNENSLHKRDRTCRFSLATRAFYPQAKLPLTIVSAHVPSPHFSLEQKEYWKILYDRLKIAIWNKIPNAHRSTARSHDGTNIYEVTRLE